MTSGPTPPDLPLLASAEPPVRGGGTFEVTRRFDLGTDLYLDDHRLDGRPVLPFAVALEFLAETVAAGWPGREFAGFRGPRMLRGVTFDGPSVTLKAVARESAGDDGGTTVELTLAPADSPARPHYRATALLREPGATPAFEPEPWDLGAAGPLPLGLDGVYRDWLFHGPLFQGIASVESIGPRGARATLRASSPGLCLRGGPSRGWLIDPVVLDSALQMQVVWARLHWGITLLPSQAARFLRFDTLGREPGEAVRYELRVRPDSAAPICHTDHLFFDAAGRCLAVLSDMEGTGSEALNRLAGAAGRR